LLQPLPLQVLAGKPLVALDTLAQLRQFPVVSDDAQMGVGGKLEKFHLCDTLGLTTSD